MKTLGSLLPVALTGGIKHVGKVKGSYFSLMSVNHRLKQDENFTERKPIN